MGGAQGSNSNHDVGIVHRSVDSPVSGTDDDPGNDTDFRAEDPRDLHFHYRVPAVHDDHRRRVCEKSLFLRFLFLKFLRKLAFGICVEYFYELMDTSEWLVVEDLQQLLHFALGVLHFTLTIGPVS